MDKELLDLHKRNKLMAIVLCMCVVLGALSAFKYPITMMAILKYASPAALFIVFLVWRKVAIPYLMYIIALGFNFVSFFMIKSTTNFPNSLVLYLSLAIISIYHNYRPLLLNGVIGVFILNYALFTKPAYAHIDRFSPNAYFIFCLVALVAQSRVGTQMLAKIRQGAIESENSKKKADELLEKVSHTVEILRKSTINLQGNATSTGTISEELVAAFKEISIGIETQTASFNDVLQAMQDVADTAQQTADASSNMSQMSRNTTEVTGEGQEKMKAMSKQMQEIDQFVDSTSIAIGKVNEESVKIDNIVSMIKEIANQTNLLSLNASIEAARAGEHGKGFSVVASEIRKLAMNSHNASEQVNLSIKLIQEKIRQVNELVQNGLKIVVSGKQSVSIVEQLFNQIKINSEEVLNQAESLSLINERLLQSAHKVTDEMSTVAAISEKSSASVQGVLANADIQQNRISSMIESIEELTDLMKTLDQNMNQ
ncbi:methyl-accepting chemotaxis protein [Acetivibrio mesophilus]|uniref:Methyl-accepting chemotaxis protein n=1 Tax=Acetivibrio mesophilus TaxID=2487273 RepID=A0A4Q0I544_9FIRM|nr:methyl-accepting chemotaxis protein [Acetivibrio mesophilus]RXE59444.1 methyl-accepting chemotaxis protein [Acetivibrio mesophilus]HHV30233.1 methyl-accepting chemotaxis protein [Clostridium sp.]